MIEIIHETVRPGDGFYVIASRLAPAGISKVQRNAFAKTIAEANGMTLTSVIHPGQVLHINPSSIPTV